MDSIEPQAMENRSPQNSELPRHYRDFLRWAAAKPNPKFPILLNLLDFMEGKTPRVDSFTRFALRLSVMDFGNDSQLSRRGWCYYNDELHRRSPPYWWDGSGAFKETIELGPPPGSKTRIIFVGIEGDTFFHAMIREFADVIEILGYNLDIEALFFARFVSLCLGKHDPILGSRKEPRFLDLDMSTPWGGFHALGVVRDCFSEKIGRYNTIVMLADYAGLKTQDWSSLRTPLRHRSKLEWGRVGNDNFGLHMQGLLAGFTPNDITWANEHPCGYMVVMLNLFYAYMEALTKSARLQHREWLVPSGRTSQRDDKRMHKSWHNFRSDTDSFDLVIKRWVSFVSSNEPSSNTSSSTNPGEITTTKVDKLSKSLHELLEEARVVEGLLRDTLQLHIGNVALEESRKSIKQADSVGRVTFLAFVFLPLSLITSFFGMNIQELNGQGANIRWFIVSAVCFSLFTFMCWVLWLLLGKVYLRYHEKIEQWAKKKRERNIFTSGGRWMRNLDARVKGRSENEAKGTVVESNSSKV